MCLTGGLYRTMTRPFDTGDWIEVGDIRGEVLQEGFMSTILHELSPAGDQSHDYTGHIITMPNAMILSHNIINLNIRKQYVFHTFAIAVNALEYLRPKEDLAYLVDAIQTEWTAYDEEATKYWTTVRRHMATHHNTVFVAHSRSYRNIEVDRFESQLTSTVGKLSDTDKSGWSRPACRLLA